MKLLPILILLTFITCKSKTTTAATNNEDKPDVSVKTIEVNPSYFINYNLLQEIVKEKKTVNGLEREFYVIKSKSQPIEHNMGPWCPKHIDDTKAQGGLWFKDGQVYNVDGHFIASLSDFYKDDKWKLFREDGSVKHTKTKEACLGAAKPDVEEEYKNHCVECLPEYFKDQITTFYIPVKPMYYKKSKSLQRGGLGVALNGVKFDPPAPTHAILAAHTIAPLDPQGGHVNPHGGYHYHAATGYNKEIKQKDNHASLIGYAIDGFGIYTSLSKQEKEVDDLDECGGHFDEIRGYHYHAGTPGDNQIISCFKGEVGFTEIVE